jgi:hypothetical protein
LFAAWLAQELRKIRVADPTSRVFRILELLIEWVSELALSVTGLHLLISSVQLVQETTSRPTSSWGFSITNHEKDSGIVFAIEFGGFRVELYVRLFRSQSHNGFKE